MDDAGDIAARLNGALGGAYQVERELGRGGMAVVFLAHDLRHHRHVALKVLRPELSGAIGPERFLREIEIAAGLTHPHILAVHDSGEADGLLYYVMPFVEGESLRDRLDREGQLPLEDALHIVREVADALSYAHSRGVVHRDVKPENILLAGDHALVADFGIARAIEAADAGRVTEAGLVLGTAAYMSPEQATGERKLDGRADVYALGCVLYELLTGDVPFTGPTQQTILARRLTEPVPRVRLVRDGVPEAVDEAIAKALARMPADRFVTVARFAEALAPPPGGTRAEVPRPRSRVPARVVAGALLAGAAGIGLLWWRGGAPAGPADHASVAVLYFENQSPDSADAYLADGLTEELTARLGEIARLGVKSRTAVRRFRDRAAEDPGELGRALRVAHLVNGSVRRAGPRIRVTVELVQAATGVRVWGEQYDRTGGDLLAIEEDIARGVVRAIAGRLLPAERALLATRPTASAEAYDRFLRGNFLLARRNPRDAARALDEYEAAVRYDPHFTQALARIAYGHALFLDWGWDFPGVTPENLLARGLAVADRAMRADSGASDVWMARAYLLSHRDPRGFAGVANAFERAIALDPRNAEAYHQYAWIRWLLGEDGEAADLLHRALALDPERVISLEALARLEFAARRYAEAHRWLDSALSLDPAFAFARQWRARHRLLAGDTAGARVEAETALHLGVPEGGEEVLALVEARAGLRRQARERVDRIVRGLPGRGPLKFQQAVYAAATLVALDEPARALDLLERVTSRGGAYWSHLRMPEFDDIRMHPRFVRIVRDTRPADPGPRT